VRPIAKGIVWLGGHTGLYLVGVVEREEEIERWERREEEEDEEEGQEGQINSGIGHRREPLRLHRKQLQHYDLTPRTLSGVHGLESAQLNR
jgi:hypothetical protein